MDLLYRIKRIKRIIEWIPVLWKTEDWDHGFMTQIWSYSLKRLRDSMINGHSVMSETRLKNINTAIFLLKRIGRDHEYTDLDIDLLIRKYGPLGIPGIDKETWPKEAIKELVDLSKKDKYLFNQDIDLLSKILKKHLLGWWD